jgi:hypothetical protein
VRPNPLRALNAHKSQPKKSKQGSAFVEFTDFKERDYFRLADHPSGTLRRSFSELNERIVLYATIDIRQIAGVDARLGD